MSDESLSILKSDTNQFTKLNLPVIEWCEIYTIQCLFDSVIMYQIHQEESSQACSGQNHFLSKPFP